MEVKHKPNMLLSAIKFICGETANVCRLCFAPTNKNDEVFLYESVTLQCSYYDGTATYTEMLQGLGFPEESCLPESLCQNCANETISAYAFSKLCIMSNNKWLEATDCLEKCLKFPQIMKTNVKTAFILTTNTKIKVLTSKQRISRNKTVAWHKAQMILKKNETLKKEKKFHCTDCSQKFSNMKSLAKHNLYIHNITVHACSKCPKTFSSSYQLETHIERIHTPKVIHCEECDQKFGSMRLLKYHKKSHHTAAACKLCPQKFSSQQELANHYKEHKTNECPHCHKVLKSKHNLRMHLKVCTGLGIVSAPAYFCDICGKGYAHKNGIRTHMIVEHGFGTTINCKWCGKKFTAISRLKNHIVTHTGEKNFYCEICGGQFVTEKSLVYHTRIHTGETPYKCDMCDQSFLSASRRMEHRRRKHLGPHKECSVCHLKFVTSHELNKHYKRHFNPQSKLYVKYAMDNELPIEYEVFYDTTDVPEI